MELPGRNEISDDIFIMIFKKMVMCFHSFDKQAYCTSTTTVSIKCILLLSSYP